MDTSKEESVYHELYASSLKDFYITKTEDHLKDNANFSQDTSVSDYRYVPDLLTSSQTLISCMLYAAVGTIFYKKRFNISMIEVVLILITLGVCVQFDMPPELRIILIVTCVCKLFCFCEFSWLGMSDIISFLLYFMVLLDVRTTFIAATGLHIPHFVRILATALPQFIRRPDWVKSRLQKLRSKFGPLFVLYTCIAAVGWVSQPRNTFQCLMAIIAGTTSIVAGILFRPDNSTILALFYKGTDLTVRKKFHKWLMISSFVCYLLCFL